MHKKLIFTITNDPDFDQRMQRICGTLYDAGYTIVLVGRKMRGTTGIKLPYTVKRMHCLFHKGPLLYLEYNFRIFCWLLVQRADIVCAIDLDTILPVYMASRLRGFTRIYDAHEFFSELKEVVTRPTVQRWWKKIEDFAIPRFPNGYTVGECIANIFHKKYGVNYGIIRNVPLKTEKLWADPDKKQAIIYQGAINEARGLEFLIPAMLTVEAELHIYGAGNLENFCRQQVDSLGLNEKVRFFGMVSPSALKDITPSYKIGINLVEPVGLNQYYSLANKFFDYIHAGVPQVTMNFPEYARINEIAPVALLIDEPETSSISKALNLLLGDVVLYRQLTNNCAVLREMYCWETEKNSLLQIYDKL